MLKYMTEFNFAKPEPVEGQEDTKDSKPKRFNFYTHGGRSQDY